MFSSFHSIKSLITTQKGLILSPKISEKDIEEANALHKKITVEVQKYLDDPYSKLLWQIKIKQAQSESIKNFPYKQPTPPDFSS